MNIENGVLSISAERKRSHETKTDKMHSVERSYGRVQRRFRIPELADADHANAVYKDGVLTVSFPKLAQIKDGKRKLEIQRS